jgi:hypothetical protein
MNHQEKYQMLFTTPRRPLAAAVTLAGALVGTVAMAGPSQADSGPSSGKHAFTDVSHNQQLSVQGENVTLGHSGEQIEIQDDGDGKRILKTDDGKCFANHSETLKAQECMDKGDKDRKEQEWKLETADGGYRMKNQNLYVRVGQGGHDIRLDKGAEHASVFRLGGGTGITLGMPGGYQPYKYPQKPSSPMGSTKEVTLKVNNYAWYTARACVESEHVGSDKGENDGCTEHHAGVDGGQKTAKVRVPVGHDFTIKGDIKSANDTAPYEWKMSEHGAVPQDEICFRFDGTLFDKKLSKVDCEDYK